MSNEEKDYTIESGKFGDIAVFSDPAKAFYARCALLLSGVNPEDIGISGAKDVEAANSRNALSQRLGIDIPVKDFEDIYAKGKPLIEQLLARTSGLARQMNANAPPQAVSLALRFSGEPPKLMIALNVGTSEYHSKADDAYAVCAKAMARQLNSHGIPSTPKRRGKTDEKGNPVEPVKRTVNIEVMRDIDYLKGLNEMLQRASGTAVDKPAPARNITPSDRINYGRGEDSSPRR